MAQQVKIDFVTAGADANVSAWEALDKAIISSTTTLRKDTAENARHVAELHRRRAAQQAANEQLKLAAKITAELQTPQQKYLEGIKQAKQLLADGAITQDTFTARQRALQKSYLEASGAIERKRQAEASANATLKEARAIIEGVLTPQQKYDAEVTRLKSHHDAGRLSAEQYSAAVAREKQRLEDATGATDRKRQAELRASQVMRQAREITQSVISPAERYRAKLEELRQHLNAGRISQETFNRSAAQARQSFDHVATAGAKVEGLKFDKVISGLRGMTAALVGGSGVLAAVNAVIDAKKRLDDAANQAAADTGPAFSTLENQTGFQGQAAADAQRRVEEIAYNRRIPTAEAAYAAAELAGANVKPEVATGGGIDAILQTMNATMAKERQNPLMAGDFAKAMLAFLKAQGVESPDAKQLREVGKNLHALFKKTNLQAEDLANLGEVASTGANVMTMQEQFALYAQLREIKNPAEAAVAFRQVSLKLQTARANDTAAGAIEGETPEQAATRVAKGKKAAESLGLKLEDVDLVGETVDVVVDRLRKAMNNVKPESRMAILTDIVGEYAAAAFQSLINVGGDPIRQKVAMQQDAGVAQRFEEDARKTEQLPFRVAIAQKNVQEQELLRRYQGTELAKQQMTNALLKRDVAPLSIEASQKAFDKAVGAGAEPFNATKAGLAMSGLGEEQAREIETELKALQGKAGLNRPIDRLRDIGVDPGTENNAAQLDQLGAIPEVRAGFARMQLEKALAALDSKAAGDKPFDVEKARAGAERLIEQRKADRPGALERVLSDYLERFSVERTAESGPTSKPYRPRGQAEAIATLREAALKKEQAARDAAAESSDATTTADEPMFSDGNEGARRRAAAEGTDASTAMNERRRPVNRIYETLERMDFTKPVTGRELAAAQSAAPNANNRDTLQLANAGEEQTARTGPDGRRSFDLPAVNEAARQVSALPVINVASPVVNVDLPAFAELLKAIQEQTELMKAERDERRSMAANMPLPRRSMSFQTPVAALGRSYG